jgi:hypothetical protein
MNIESLNLVNDPNLPKKQYVIVLHCFFEADALFENLYQDVLIEQIKNEKQLFHLVLEILLIKNLSLVENMGNYIEHIEKNDSHFSWINKIQKNFYQTAYISKLNIYYYNELSCKYEVELNYQKEECEIKSFYDKIKDSDDENKVLIEIENFIQSYLEKEHLTNQINDNETLQRNIKI